MSSSLQYQKICIFCGREFIAQKFTTEYCSHACSQRAYKQRKREQKMQQNRITPTEDSEPEPILQDKEREYLSCEQVADLMGICRTTVYRYCISGKMNCIKMNRKIFIQRSDIRGLFEHPQPYKVKPLYRKPITEFYSMREITEKYGVSESMVYNIVSTQRIPKGLSQGKTIYSKKHVDKHFAAKLPDPQVAEWYTVEEIREKYGMSLSAVYSFTSEYGIPRKKNGGKTYYSKAHTDTHLRMRQPDPTIKEWYSMEEIIAKYDLTPGFVSNLIYKNPIPKIRRGNKGYYSKADFDRLVREKQLVPEYYTVEEAMARYNLTRDRLYHYVRFHNIPKIQEGRYIKISKPELDALFAQPNSL